MLSNDFRRIDAKVIYSSGNRKTVCIIVKIPEINDCSSEYSVRPEWSPYTFRCTELDLCDG